ncbi:hypothetical protein [Kordiimonas sp.]|uniref:hypothetical protein n=1 Tax=Kordiimonas sp. TaxID=1970157 RepID=UPI003A8F9CDE
MTTKPKTGDYTGGWKPEAGLKNDAKELLHIIFDPDTSPNDAAGAAATLVEIVDPQVMFEATRGSCAELEHAEKVEDALLYLRGDIERFRRILSDKDELLAKVCRYAELEADHLGIEPWSIIGRMFGHGSGVSSAIYDVYKSTTEPKH